MSAALNTATALPQEWQEWVMTNIMRGVQTDAIIDTLKNHRFSDAQIKAALSDEPELSANESKQTIRKLPNNWKEWVASNLLAGTSKAGIVKTLAQQGFSSAEIALEIQTASKSPYLRAAAKTAQTLKKREWLLATCDHLARLDPGYNQQLDVIDTPAFEVFIKNYYSKHKPVVLQNGIEHWPALKKWSPQYFAEVLGTAEIQVQFDRESDALFERHSDKYRKSMRMSEFVDMIENDGESNNYYMTANNTQQNVDAIRPAFADIGDFGDGYRQLFADDPAFSTYFWMGPKGTFTPLHHDLTNNMLVQIYGRKKVTLIPAWQVPWMYNDLHVYSEVDFPNVNLKTHPLMQHVTPVEVTIAAGDALFIPIGWWHCVEGLDKSISISFTNFNAPNSYAEGFKKAQG
ncbi:cupin-like domain-containing protein [Psychrobacter celer]|uniref:cupin-like domain-containing protein n=1 Tax=Psychrobacter celer TaxID=306572 RepID=UPI003FD33D1E